MSSIADNLGSVTRRIQKATLQAGRDAGSVSLLAVSKTRSAEELREAATAGQLAFGENYLQEALDKMSELSDLADIEWHFIGPIQSNKTRQIAAAFSWVHSVDRLKVARRLSEQRETGLPPLNICLQVNINNEQSKSGCRPEELPELVSEISQLPGLTLRGLMAIPDPDQSETGLRQSFRMLANALKELKRDFPEAGPLDTLSMGMSGDLETAIAEGSTCVRIGTAVFGERSRKS
ncbi:MULTISPECIES: YggS family pyridoxal phosphate-dependent enzyme [Marinobacter]|uniref:Pyridoxal phosphate homeostasis protein n=1 Tax=Marinobacter xiaoshiensis TaxID=3073652 RepID=A0ABU2HBY4_9GAMM|nr:MULTISPECIES: YggS family pyridoxal phosphate-dependent enzyme [unclassified Marinobacter]MBK1874045.1 YggS family pyridoxal phosphate-dependent enzyme [Marinobacter sp. 1-3A]MBK1888023.1 YggS family pyridoxal phosphate-dependent enzyme [Marinobacter sp. DY40_1A1]MDS1308547.1 YggS family pyridoxal phosphate-dependent enzyme [Marinobacter sp. F60267]